VAAEENSEEIGRIRMRRIRNGQRNTLAHAENGSCITVPIRAVQIGNSGLSLAPVGVRTTIRAASFYLIGG
jgi:hypothetical protein